LYKMNVRKTDSANYFSMLVVIIVRADDIIRH